MAVTVKHAFTSAKSDGADATLVQPSSWNADHSVSGLTTVATDAIWDAAGDLAVGSGADTAVRLAKGNAGGVLAMGNGAVIWNAGTSFPASKATGDRYWRTDLGMEFYWDGTRWLSVVTYHADFPLTDTDLPWTGIGAQGFNRWVAYSGDYDIWLIKHHIWTYVGTTNNGSNYWVFKLEKAGSGTSIRTFNTSADTANVYTSHSGTIGALLGTSELGANVITTSKTGTPGPLYTASAMEYKIVGT